MTRVNPLVLDGKEVKLRLEAERTETGVPVHVDWLRFTVQLRNAPIPSIDELFPKPTTTSIYDRAFVQAQIRQVLTLLPDEDFAPGAQAMELGQQVCSVLGEGFEIHPELRKGHDFYKHRFSILRNGNECGWVGFLSGTNGPAKAAQDRSLHVNLYGHACTFARIGWASAMADLIDQTKGEVTRCDIALDFFDGYSGGMDRVMGDYKAGLCDVGGRRLKSTVGGDWANGRARSFYVGTREVGKITNAYEKGHQLFGENSGHPWMRFELRYGNKARVLPSDILRRPADFFAGASSWHASLIAEANAEFEREVIPCRGRLALETVNAEVTRNVNWFKRVAMPTASRLFQNLGMEFLYFVSGDRTPGRLKHFSEDEISHALRKLYPSVEDCAPVFA